MREIGNSRAEYADVGECACVLEDTSSLSSDSEVGEGLLLQLGGELSLEGVNLADGMC